MHVKIASKVLREIKERQIDKLQDIEEEAITTRRLVGENKDDLVKILEFPCSNPKSDHFLDKVRILVIMILCLKDTDELQKYVQMVEEVHKEVAAEVDTIEKVKVMLAKKIDIKGKQTS